MQIEIPKTRTLLYGLILFLLTVFSSYFLLRKSQAGDRITRVFHNAMNTQLSNCFSNTLMHFQALDQKPMQFSVKNADFSLAGADPIPNYDTRINFVNKKKLEDDVQHSYNTGKAQAQVNLYYYKFSFYHYFLLPIFLLISLWIGIIPMVGFSPVRFIGSIVFLKLVLCLRFALSLIYMRGRAEMMEFFDVSDLMLNVLKINNSLDHIEFTYVMTLMIFILFAYSKLKSLIKFNMPEQSKIENKEQ